MPEPSDPSARRRAALHLWTGTEHAARLHPPACLAARSAGLFRHQFHAAGHRHRAADHDCLLAELQLPSGLTWHPPPSETAATERCTWRGRVMRGEVHDENAFALGGAAGHAGLFGTIDGVLDAAQRLLQGADPWLPELRKRQSRNTMPGVGGASRRMVRRQRLLRRNHRSYRLHRHRRVDRFRARPGLGVADQPRASDPPPGHRHRHAAPPRRRSDRRSGIVTLRQCSLPAAIAVLLFTTAATGFAASMDDLLRAYPDSLAGFDGTDLIWRDGTRMQVDDGRPDKSMEEQLRHGSILDQLRLPYPAGAPALPRRNRIRAGSATKRSSTRCMATARQVRWRRGWCLSSGCRTRGDTSSASPRSMASIGSWQQISRELDELPADGQEIPLPAGRHLCCVGPLPTPARPACTAGVRRSISTRHSRTIGYGTVPPEALPTYVESYPLGNRRRLRAARFHLGRPLGAFRHDALRIPPRTAAGRTQSDRPVIPVPVALAVDVTARQRSNHVVGPRLIRASPSDGC